MHSSPSLKMSVNGHLQKAPSWAVQLNRLTTYLSEEFGGQPVLKLAWAINFHKVITAFLILAMMRWFNNYSVTAWVYLGLHGTYGFCWLLKDLSCRDKRLEKRIPIIGALMIYVALIAWYWTLPYLVISRHVEASGPLLWLCITMHTLGCVLMVIADVHKNLVMRYETGLITSGTFAYTRNPNYLGEMIIYSSYAILAHHWFPWVVLAWAWIGVFWPQMLIKDASISRHSGWDEYRRRSGLLIPWQVINGRALIRLLK